MRKDIPESGLLDEFRAATEEVRQWPDWKKREAGVGPVLEAIDRLRQSSRSERNSQEARKKRTKKAG